jgi:peptide subunit release factor 1 (eRF1)
MFTSQDLDKLLSFRSEQAHVLSLYLNVDPTQQTTEKWKLMLRSLLKEAAGDAEPADIEAVERYFDFEYDWKGKGVAVFSCQEANFWATHSLAVPVQNQAYVSHRPYIKPLTDVLDAYGRYGVVLVDGVGARMFLFNLGELVETTGLLGEEVRRAKHGAASGVAGMRGGAATRTARREESVIERNLKEVADATEAFCTKGGCTRLVLSGTDANVSQFEDLLPKVLRDKVIGHFPIEFGAPVAEIQSRSMEIIEQEALEREEALVEELLARWKRGAGAAVGLSDTLAALQEHRPSTLLIGAGLSASGYRCQDCRYLMLTEREECPLCGGAIEAVDDLVDTMTHRALEQGVDVEIVRGNAALKEAGSIGALLRF